VTRARAFQVEYYTRETRRRYEYVISLYRRDAALAGIDPLQPGLPWLHDWLRRMIALKSLQFARICGHALRYHFRIRGVGNLIDDPGTRALLQYSRHIEDIRAIVAANDVPALHERAVSLAGFAYAPSTLHQYRRESERWEQYAEARGIDPLAPSVSDICDWLEIVARRYRYWGARTMRSAISFYLRMARVRDVSHDRAIDQLLDSMNKVLPKRANPPLLAADVRWLLAHLGTEPYDIRDRVVILLAFFCGLDGKELVRLDTASFTIEDDCVVRIHLPSGDIRCISGVEDLGCCLAAWLRQWCTLIPSGPLFPVITARGSWSATSMSESGLVRSVQRIARALGYKRHNLLMALKRGFIQEAVPPCGATAVAHHLRYKSLSGLARHSGAVRAMNGAYRRHRRAIVSL